MDSHNNEKFISVSEAAHVIGVSRVTVFLWIKKGLIQAQKVGRNYIIPYQEILKHVENRPINEQEKMRIKEGLEKALHDFGETIRMLGKE